MEKHIIASTKKIKGLMPYRVKVDKFGQFFYFYELAGTKATDKELDAAWATASDAVRDVYSAAFRDAAWATASDAVRDVYSAAFRDAAKTIKRPVPMGLSRFVCKSCGEVYFSIPTILNSNMIIEVCDECQNV